ncbi:MAG: PIG-L family deacetylase [Actinomycetales bacterium]|nr:PIG-L family deacetylase [Actinomycetales bacterium]
MARMGLPEVTLTRVLCVAAHPDDLDFAVSGTVAGFVEAGMDVTYLLCTRGEQGGFDETPREEMPVIREREQRAAADALGVKDVRFLDGYRDGWLEPTPELQREITQVIRQVRPHRILTSSPDRNWDRIAASHPDHLAAGEATVRAVYPAARNPFAFPELLAEGLEPWTVGELWLWGHPAPTHAVDVTDRFDRKLAALREHTSQTAHQENLEQWLRERGAATAKAHGLSRGRLAEAFRVVTTG